MPRPPMPVGTFGKITDYELPDGKHQARTKFRDYDGQVRLVSRTAASPAAAERALKAALTERQSPGGTDIVTPDTKISALADKWREAIDESDRASGTKQNYAYVVNAYVKPALGGLRVRECATPDVDRALKAIREKHGPGAARSTRSVLAGMFGLAARHGAKPVNPTREVERIGGRKKPRRSLTDDQVTEIIDTSRSSLWAVERDLPDLIEWMLGTGCRIGEACAARHGVNADGDPLLDLTAGTWEINATVVRITGRGLYIQERPKSAAGWRVIALPPFAVDMLGRRQGERRFKGPDGVTFPSPFAHQLRDPSNTPDDLRYFLNSIDCAACDYRGWLPGKDSKGRTKKIPCPAGKYSWVTSHTFRKTVATRLDEGGCTAREIADQLGHAQPSMTLDIYMGRSVVTRRAAVLLER